MKTYSFLLVLVLLISSVFVRPAWVEEASDVTVHVVKLLNKGEGGSMVFDPAIVFAQPGDTIRFEAVSKGHNAETFSNMIPEGATPFATKLSKTEDVVVDAEGTWGYFCKPHKTMGMVGWIVVGDANINDAVIGKKVPPLAKKRFQMYIDEVEKFSNLPAKEEETSSEVP